MKGVSVHTYIQTATGAFLLLFNAGIAARVAKTYIDGMLDEEFNFKKKVLNLVKAAIVVNSIGGLIFIIEKYF